MSCFFILIIIAVLYFSFIWFPHWEAAKYGIIDPKDLADAENSRRATSAQILGGVAVGIGLYCTWRRINIAEDNLKVTQENLEVTQKVAQDNLKISQEGQITERFTRAVDQLGAINKLERPAIEIRLGGIYALGRIANESEKDYWPIMEILTAYLRKNSRILEEIYEEDSGAIEAMDEYINEKNREIFYFDIQAIIAVIRKCTIIRRSKSSFTAEEENYLDLQKTDLRRSDFREADLRGANFEEAHLPGANLQEVDLRDARLVKTNLYMANLEQANLYRANFKGAKLLKAKLRRANLEEAILEGAELEGADLRVAHLQEANLKGANLKGADLKEANLQKANFERTNLEGADLEGADLRVISFSPLKDSNPKTLTIEQLSKVKTLYSAKLDEEFRVPLKKNYPGLFEETFEETNE